MESSGQASTQFNNVSDSWQYLDIDIQQRLQNYVRELPTMFLEEVEFLLRYAPLQKQARERVAAATKKELGQALFFVLPSEVADRWITIYLASTSFEDANSWAKQMIAESNDFTAEHMRRILTSSAKNPQITGSFQIGPLIANLRSKNKIPADEFEKLLKDNGLQEFLLPTTGY